MNEHIKITCEICEDLLPLVEDGIATEDSKEAVRRHIAACAKCHSKYQSLAAQEGKGADLPVGIEKNDHKIITGIRERISIWLLLGISVSLLTGVLIVITSVSSPWLIILVFPCICSLVYVIGGSVWKFVPFIAAAFWIMVTLLMDIGKTANWQAAISDSIISAVLPFVFSYIGALAAALLKYSFKGEF